MSTDRAARRPSPRERTQRLLEEAARDLLRSGAPLTVQAAAELAGVSRATAYRYFPSNEAVVMHATMPLVADADQQLEVPDAASEADPAADLPDQASALVRSMGTWAFDHENELRTLLRLSLAPERAGTSPRRGNTNRGRWIAQLLEGLPDHVSPASRERLAVALVPLFGADAVVWSADIAQVDRDTALDVMAWMAAALVRATVDGDA
ncbi:TetR/AcrR family transcriptional regulator [Phycicoccus flavus]|uniref:TetR/AcrR family transcriptional regulator n=1 Tax=Phycicoccus flavus TaxID=2502783 RepID=UPI000FEB61E0|nr:TetR/AcrR family transcriptional regulator [Phycicoccus flavus]NHA67686.1 TetR/AcrR family transcriptional regulator [Phycicoccus flavus]